MFLTRHNILYPLFAILLLTGRAFALDAVDIAIDQLQLGKKYEWAGNGPDVFDCSGLTQYAYRQVGVEIPRTSGEQSQFGEPVVGELQRGDLLFFATRDSMPEVVSHVGIYEADNIMINAENEDIDIHRADITSDYWSNRFLFARRISLDEPSSTLRIACGNPPQGVVGTPYSYAFPAMGGATPYIFSIIDGDLPGGLSLNPVTGEISGTPEATGTFTFTVQVADSNAITGQGTALQGTWTFSGTGQDDTITSTSAFPFEGQSKGTEGAVTELRDGGNQFETAITCGFGGGGLGPWNHNDILGVKMNGGGVERGLGLFHSGPGSFADCTQPGTYYYVIAHNIGTNLWALDGYYALYFDGSDVSPVIASVECSVNIFLGQ